MSDPDSGGNGRELAKRVAELEGELPRLSGRLHRVERDVCTHALEASEEARRARDAVVDQGRELARFERDVSKLLGRLEDRLCDIEKLLIKLAGVAS